MNPEFDPRLDQILNALRTTDPPPGLEARINARLAQASQARLVTPSFFAAILNAAKAPRIFYLPTTLYVSTATACILILAMLFPRLHSSRHPNASAPSHPIPMQSHTATRPPTASSNSPTNAYLATDNSSPQALRRNRHTVKLPKDNAHSFSVDHSRPPASPDTIALADMLAPSFPAPPEPPTAQEKLLVRVVQRGDPQVLTMLNPILRAQQEAKEIKDFEEFAGIQNTSHRL